MKQLMILLVLITFAVCLAAQNPDWLFAYKAGGVSNLNSYRVDVEAMAVDAAGNSYIAGSFAGTAVFGSTTLSCASYSFSAFVAKMAPNGTWLWAKQVTHEWSSYGSIAYGLSLDTAGNVYIGGTIPYGTVTFGTLTLAMGSDTSSIFAAQLDSNGQWIWAKTFNSGAGSGYEAVRAVAVSPDGYIYISGLTEGAVFGSTTLSSGGFIAKLNNAGSVQWAKGASTVIYELAVSTNDIIFGAGVFTGSATFGAYNITQTFGSTTTVFVVKINGSGVWQGAIKGGNNTLDTWNSGLAADASGYAYICGFMDGGAGYSYYADFGSFRFYNIAGRSDGFVAKTNTSAWQWASRIDCPDYSYLYDIKYQNGNLCAIGNYNYSLICGSITMAGSDARTKVVLAQLNPATGAFNWAVNASPTGASNYATGKALAFGANDEIYTSGAFTGTVNFSPYTITQGTGVYDIFMTKYKYYAPNAVTLVSPANTATGVAYSGTTFTWQALTSGPLPQGYKFYLGTNDPPTNLVNGTALGNVLTYTHPSNLSSETLYYWKVLSYNQLDGESSAIWSFTTTYIPPDPATAVYPANNATGIEFINPYLSWTRSLTGSIPTGYKLYFGTNNPPTNMINGTDLGNVTRYDFPANLNVLVQYYWKIIPYIPQGEAVNCPVWTFTTSSGLPNPAITPNPADNATNVAVTTSLGWTAASSGKPATGYKLYFGTSNPPSNLVNGTDLGNVLSYLPSASLSQSTTYFWQIVPYNTYGNALNCPVWRFTTFTPAITYVFPDNNATQLPRLVTIDWRTSIQVTGFKVKMNGIQIATVPYVANQTFYYYALPQLDWNTDATWQVIAYIGATDYYAGDIRTFNVMSEPTNVPANPAAVVYNNIPGFSGQNNFGSGALALPPITLAGTTITPYFYFSLTNAVTSTNLYVRVMNQPSHPLANPTICIASLKTYLPMGNPAMIYMSYSTSNTAVAVLHWNGIRWDDITASATLDIGMAGWLGINWTSTNRGDEEFAILSGPYNETLPVELSSFTAILTTENYVGLNWTTQSETDMSGFNVFRNTSNALDSSVMINSFIITATNSSQTQNYTFNDQETEEDNTYYYWLQTVENGGNVSYHGPVEIRVNNGDDQTPDPSITFSTGLKNVFPNPFNSSASIQYYLEKDAPLQIQIFNSKGQIIQSIPIGWQNKGTHNMQWNGKDSAGNDCASGVYLIKMSSGKSHSLLKALLLK